MKISDDQIKTLITICLEFYGFLELMDARKEKRESILNFITEIVGQQDDNK